MPRINKALLSCLLFCLSLPAFAVPFQNGDFSSAADWIDASTTGGATTNSGEGILTTGAGDDPYSAILVQGDDGFFNFSSPITLGASDATLSFYARIEDFGVDITESGGSIFNDYLNVNVYDANDLSYDLSFTPGLNSTMSLFNLDVSSLVGRDVAISFELSDQNDGRNTRVYLDNISFQFGELVEVPEPQSIALLGLGLLSFVAIRSRRRRT